MYQRNVITDILITCAYFKQECPKQINFLFCHKTNKIRNFVGYMKKVLFLLFVVSNIVSCGGKQTNGGRHAPL